MQLEVFNNFIKDFQEEENSLNIEPDFTDKEKEFEKREKDEFRKLEKIFKKENAEIDDIYNDTTVNPTKRE